MDTEYDLEKEILADGEASDPTGQFYSVPVPVLVPTQQKTLELLSHLASYSELLVTVVGPEGAGKSVIARALAAQREEPESSLFLNGDLMLGMPAILSAVAGHWDMPQLPEDTVAARDAIRSQAAAKSEYGENLLVIIDRAEQLDSDTLNAIANFALMAPQTLSFALFGREGFELEIRESPANAPLHREEIHPFTHEDCALLIQQVYSPDNALQLTDDDIAAIYEQGQGNPADMLRAADDLFLSESAAENAVAVSKATRFPLTHLLAIAAVGAALVMSFLYSGYSDEEPPAPLVSESVTDAAELAVATPSPESEPLSSFDGETAVVEPPVVATEPDYNYSGSAGAVVASEEPAMQAPVETDVADVELAPVVEVSEEQVVAVDDKPAIEEPAVVAEAEPTPAYTAAEQRLLAVESGFIVQLFGSYQSANATRFINDWSDKVAGSLYQYQTLHQGKAWYVVVAATYGSRDEAKAAVNSLPQALRRQSPWIRDVAAAQEAIRQR